jgi:hypothetical protein
MVRPADVLRFWNSLNGRLISWEESGAFELAASQVLCLTPTLEWAFRNSDKIMTDLGQKSTKAYRYIVFSNHEEGSDELAVKHAHALLDKAKAHPSLQSRDAISILFLTGNGSPSPSHWWRPNRESREVPPLRDWAYLPIPTDIVVYVETRDLTKRSSERSTFAVMSVVPVHERLATVVATPILENRKYRLLSRSLGRFQRGMRFEYDIQFADPKHYRPIKTWFEHEWKRRTVET